MSKTFAIMFTIKLTISRTSHYHDHRCHLDDPSSLLVHFTVLVDVVVDMAFLWSLLLLLLLVGKWWW